MLYEIEERWYTEVVRSRLYSSPEPQHSRAREVVVTAAGCVCSNSGTSTRNNKGSETKGVLMGEKLDLTVVRYDCSFREWLNGHSFKIVLVLSLLHIGLAYIHTQQHSGRGDYSLLPQFSLE